MTYTLELNDNQVEFISSLVGCVANETYEHMKPLTEQVFDDIMNLGMEIERQHPYAHYETGSTESEEDALEQAYQSLMKAEQSMRVPLFMDESIVCSVPRSWIAWDEMNKEGDL